MGSDITITVDPSEAILMLRNGEKKLRYAFVNSLNKTAKDIQREQQANVERTFTVRKTEFIRREAAIISFASVSKGILEASVRVGDKPRLLLSRFEKGASRGGFVGKQVAVPVTGGARPTKRSSIPKEFTFSAMALKAYRGNKRLTRKARGRHVRDYGVFGQYGRLALPEPGNRVQWRGRNRTYLVPSVGVFQRTGPKSSRLLWAFRPSVQLLPRLRFIVTGTVVAHRSFQRHMEAEARAAFAHEANRTISSVIGLSRAVRTVL